ncbi:putative TUG ubiquitin-like domain containing protein [Blattamonas nauphoetae]|uniref:TUG ubiquitin-like domain containing protein n=1 Tax=Blattamonas nauphoetae TaxID=2049346 RepID=A0ABQ9YI29_9EUKA|nr:putative TUG ubiquitin-like domain containing protein [Blattamonas nauphoetae]
MAPSVTVQYGGRKIKVNVTPGMLMKEVVISACDTLKLPSVNAKLFSKNKPVDLSSPYRLSGLVANAQLELKLVSAESSSGKAPVTVALQINGTRLISTFPKWTSLWGVLRLIESKPENEISITRNQTPITDPNTPDQRWIEPSLLYLQREVRGIAELSRVTLSSLGCEGSVSFRFVGRQSNSTLEEVTPQIDEADQAWEQLQQSPPVQSAPISSPPQSTTPPQPKPTPEYTNADLIVPHYDEPSPSLFAPQSMAFNLNPFRSEAEHVQTQQIQQQQQQFNQTPPQSQFNHSQPFIQPPIQHKPVQHPQQSQWSFDAPPPEPERPKFDVSIRPLGQPKTETSSDQTQGMLVDSPREESVQRQAVNSDNPFSDLDLGNNDYTDERFFRPAIISIGDQSTNTSLQLVHEMLAKKNTPKQAAPKPAVEVSAPLPGQSMADAFRLERDKARMFAAKDKVKAEQERIQSRHAALAASPLHGIIIHSPNVQLVQPEPEKTEESEMARDENEDEDEDLNLQPTLAEQNLRYQIIAEQNKRNENFNFDKPKTERVEEIKVDICRVRVSFSQDVWMDGLFTTSQSTVGDVFDWIQTATGLEPSQYTLFTTPPRIVYSDPSKTFKSAGFISSILLRFSSSEPLTFSDSAISETHTNYTEQIAENKTQQALKEQQTATATAAMRRAKPAARTVNREPIQRAPTVSESGGSIQPKPVNGMPKWFRK